MKIFDSFTPEVVEILKKGGVGVIPTDTVYELVGQLFNQVAVERIYDLKDREADKRVGTTLISDVTQIENYVHPEQLLRAEVFWPGSVSIEMNITQGLQYAHRGNNTLAFRMPASDILLTVIGQTGPLASTSANMAGRSTAITAQEAMAIFRESVDFYVDGGDLSGRTPSKIIKFNSSGEPEVIRGDK